MKRKGNLALVDLSGAALVQPELPLLPTQDAELFIEMIEAYTQRRVGRLRHQPQSVKRDVAIICDFLRFSHKAPWYWTEDNFDAWCFEIGVNRKIAISSQRHHQGTIRLFLQYLIENVRFRNEILRIYGIHLSQICTMENCIPHVDERELTKDRPALTHDEIDKLFGSIDKAIINAGRFGSKDFHPLQRDKVMFYTIYVAGLRSSEALGLTIHSFQENPNIPELGNYGFMGVWGKGSNGSGPRFGMVPVTHHDLPPLLKWYEEKIRHHFLKRGTANEEAFFLSERGRKMSLSTLEARFQHVIEIAGKPFAKLHL